MANLNKLAKDAELQDWLQSDSDEFREIRVDAFPTRQAMSIQTGGPIQSGLRAVESAMQDPNRQPALAELEYKISNLEGVGKTRIVRAAGAVEVEATPAAVHKIASIPEVRQIRLK